MKYNPHTGTVVGETKRAHVTAAVKATKDGAIITHLSIVSKDVSGDINYPVLQSVNLTEIRNAFRDWQMGNR